MPYEVLEKQIKALPPRYYESLVDYLEYLTKKSKEDEEVDTQISEEESLAKMREAGLKTVWEQVKNDTW